MGDGDRRIEGIGGLFDAGWGAGLEEERGPERGSRYPTRV